MEAFLDTNIFIYHLTSNHADYSPRCSALLAEIEVGKIRAHTSVCAVDEALRVLTKVFGHDRKISGDMFKLLLEIPNIHLDHRPAVLDAITFWQEHSSLSLVDCYHLALTKELEMTQIYTFDKKMDRYPGVERVEPGEK